MNHVQNQEQMYLLILVKLEMKSFCVKKMEGAHTFSKP